MALLFHFGSVTDRESVGFWDVSGACRRGYFCSDVDVGRYCRGKYQPEYQTPPLHQQLEKVENVVTREQLVSLSATYL